MTTTLLVCHGFIQNRRAFEAPGASGVAALEAAGFIVRLVEMRGRDGGPPAAGFSVYVGDAACAVEEAAADGGRVAWIGHSMGGLIGACLPDRARNRLSALVTLGAPVIPGPPRLHRPALERALVLWSRAMHARGRAFPGVRYGRAFSRARSVVESRAPLPIRLWKRGTMDQEQLDAMLHDSFASDSFAVFADLLGLISSGGRRAGDVDVHERIASLALPLLVVAGAADDLAPLGGARLLHDRATRAPRTLHTVDAGHIDLLAGRDAARTVWEPVASFLRRHAPAQVPSPSTEEDPLTPRAAPGT